MGSSNHWSTKLGSWAPSDYLPVEYKSGREDNELPSMSPLSYEEEKEKSFDIGNPCSATPTVYAENIPVNRTAPDTQAGIPLSACECWCLHSCIAFAHTKIICFIRLSQVQMQSRLYRICVHQEINTLSFSNYILKFKYLHYPICHNQSLCCGGWICRIVWVSPGSPELVTEKFKLIFYA